MCSPVGSAKFITIRDAPRPRALRSERKLEGATKESGQLAMRWKWDSVECNLRCTPEYLKSLLENRISAQRPISFIFSEYQQFGRNARRHSGATDTLLPTCVLPSAARTETPDSDHRKVLASRQPNREDEIEFISLEFRLRCERKNRSELRVPRRFPLHASLSINDRTNYVRNGKRVAQRQPVIAIVCMWRILNHVW